MMVRCNTSPACGYRQCRHFNPHEHHGLICAPGPCAYGVTGPAQDGGVACKPTDTQPAPAPNANPHIVDLVKADLDQRRVLGIQKYGTPLQAGNGRDALMDAYEEALDLCQYLKQAIEERAAWARQPETKE